MNTSVIKEAIIVGIATVILGQFVGLTLSTLMKKTQGSIRSECKKWNKNHIMEWSLFFTGVLIHLLCEYFGINKWYCKNGSACRIK